MSSSDLSRAIIEALTSNPDAAVNYSAAKCGTLVDIRVQTKSLWLDFEVVGNTGDKTVISTSVLLNFYPTQIGFDYLCKFAVLLENCDLIDLRDFHDRGKYQALVKRLPEVIDQFVALIHRQFNLICRKSEDGVWHIPIESLVPYPA